MSYVEENWNEDAPEALEEQIPTEDIDTIEPVEETNLGEEVLRAIVPLED
jgi:hypothetical protein